MRPTAYSELCDKTLFQSTHPLRDATKHKNGYIHIIAYFNPRTPYGMRLRFIEFINKRIIISIHAPLTGCDAPDIHDCCNDLRFQSTHPLRDATKFEAYKLRRELFQSTHPLRDATKKLTSGITLAIFQSTHPLRDATAGVLNSASASGISIHAPLTGCDTNFINAVVTFFNFNPRTPYGMRLNHFTLLFTTSSISIHAPLTGCDFNLIGFLLINKISIHAPLTGCDAMIVGTLDIKVDFNPRTPYGMRLESHF